jgi:AraC family transcriptional regulator of adaptative response / DNA-3-methyladenine glycosylase II
VERLAALDPEHLALPQARRRTLRALVERLADGSIDLGAGCDWARARHDLMAVRGIGAWTAEVIAMRGLGDPDAFPVTDLGLHASARHHGLPHTPRALIQRSARWRPWRSYATQHLWTSLDHAVNHWPPVSKEIA